MREAKAQTLCGSALLSGKVEPMKTETSPTETKLAKPKPEKKDVSQYCPQCSLELHGNHCKLLCPRCGYYMSCSDFY